MNISFTRITSFVVFSHLVFICLFAFSPQTTTKHVSPKKISVHTKHPPSTKQKMMVQSNHTPSVSQKINQKKPQKQAVSHTNTTPKQTAPKTKQTVTQKEKAPSKKSSPSKKLSSVLKQAKQELASLSSSTESNVETLSIPKFTLPSQSYSLATYEEQIAGELKRYLRLPERGEIDLRLTIERSGIIKQVDILKSNSTLNKNYVQKTLSSLTLPPFDGSFSTASQSTILITLTSD